MPSINLSRDDTIKMLINPFYAIKFDPDLSVDHPPLVTEENWVEANKTLLKELGSEEYLKVLLCVLKGGYTRSSSIGSEQR